MRKLTSTAVLIPFVLSIALPVLICLKFYDANFFLLYFSTLAGVIGYGITGSLVGGFETQENRQNLNLWYRFVGCLCLLTIMSSIWWFLFPYGQINILKVFSENAIESLIDNRIAIIGSLWIGFPMGLLLLAPRKITYRFSNHQETEREIEWD